MRVVDQVEWRWTLYEDAGAFYLSVLCGSIAMYSVNLRLSETEIADYSQRNRSFISRMVLQVASAPDQFAHRHLAAFSSMPQVAEANRRCQAAIAPSGS